MPHVTTLPAMAFSLIAGTILVAAALHDAAFRTVPNWMSMVLAATALMLHAIHGDLPTAMASGVVIFLAAALCWQRGWLGGGDVKLLGASAVLVPPMLGMAMLLAVALAGGVLAIVYLALGFLVAPPGTARPAGWLRRIWRAERYRLRRRGPLPYASAIAAGALVVLLKG